PLPTVTRLAAAIRPHDQRQRARPDAHDRRHPRDVSAAGWHDRGARSAAALPGRRRRDRPSLSDVSRIRDCPRRAGRVRFMGAVLNAVRVARPSGVQIPPPPPMVVGPVGVLAPVAAAIIVTLAGLVTPGYDPISRTVSRLAEPGKPAALEV